METYITNIKFEPLENNPYGEFVISIGTEIHTIYEFKSKILLLTRNRIEIFINNINNEIEDVLIFIEISGDFRITYNGENIISFYCGKYGDNDGSFFHVFKNKNLIEMFKQMLEFSKLYSKI